MDFIGISFLQVACLWLIEFPHQSAYIDAVIHSLDGVVMHPLNRVDYPGQLALDMGFSPNVLVAAEDLHRIQSAHLHFTMSATLSPSADTVFPQLGITTTLI